MKIITNDHLKNITVDLSSGILKAFVSVTALVLSACASGPGKIASWPITGAEQAALSGDVVDVLCELSGNCVEDCGAGSRQLGIKTDDNGLVLVGKNLTNYTGAVDELIGYCGRSVEINGLFTEHQGVRFFQVQNMREPGGQWIKATQFNQAWAERSGKGVGLAGKWHRNDDRVDAVIAKDGRLGLGVEADKDYFQ